MPEGEVRLIPGSSGAAVGFRVALPRAQAVLDRFRVADLCFLTMAGWGHRGPTVPAGRRSRKAIFYEVIGDRVELVGDDLFVTNVKRIAHGIEEQVFFFLTP